MMTTYGKVSAVCKEETTPDTKVQLPKKAVATLDARTKKLMDSETNLPRWKQISDPVPLSRLQQRKSSKLE